MDDEKYKGYLQDSIAILKEWAIESKKKADELNEDNDDFNQGHLMAYFSVFSLLKHQASSLDIDQKQIGLEDMDPEIDLLGLTKKEDIEPE